MIELPESFNYAEAYLTYRCPLSCDYCINGDVDRGTQELTAGKWLKGLNKIDFGKTPLTLGGGEPTLHKGFLDIVNGLDGGTKVDLLTNLEFDLDKFIGGTKPEQFSRSENPIYKSIRASYHVGQIDPAYLVAKIKILQTNGYNVGLFGLNHPENIEANMEMSEMARQEQIYFFVKDWMGTFEGQRHGTYRYPDALDDTRKKAFCKTKELLISPRGDVHRCHADLYKERNVLTNIVDDDFNIVDEFRECSDFGGCNPCDVKLKTNRFLKMGNSSVEILK